MNATPRLSWARSRWVAISADSARFSGRSANSITVTGRPAAPAVAATSRPMKPAPTMTTRFAVCSRARIWRASSTVRSRCTPPRSMPGQSGRRGRVPVASTRWS